jgi:hypothetical protein
MAFDINNFVPANFRTNSFTQQWVYQAGPTYMFEPMLPNYFTPALAQWQIKSGDKIFITFQDSSSLAFQQFGQSLSGTFTVLDGSCVVWWDSTRSISAQLDLSVTGGVTTLPYIPVCVVTQISMSVGAAVASGTPGVVFSIDGNALENGQLTIPDTTPILGFVTAVIPCTSGDDVSYAGLAVPSVAVINPAGSALPVTVSMQFVTPNNYSWVPL